MAAAGQKTECVKQIDRKENEHGDDQGQNQGYFTEKIGKRQKQEYKYKNRNMEYKKYKRKGGGNSGRDDQSANGNTRSNGNKKEGKRRS